LFILISPSRPLQHLRPCRRKPPPSTTVASRTRRGPGTANEIGQLLMAHSCNTPAVAIALARRLLAGYSQAARRLDPGREAANAVPKLHMGPVIRRRRSPLLPGRQEALLSGPDRPCILHPRPMCHLPRCGNLPSSSIHIAYTNPSLAAISQSPTITCSPIAIPSLSIHTAIALPNASCPPPATGSLPTRPTPHTRPRPFAMPCNPPRPLLVETAFCPLPRSLLHIPRPTEPIAPHRDRQVPSPHNDPSPTANLRTHLLSLSQYTHVRTRARTRRCQPTPPPSRLATYQARVTQSPPRARCSAYLPTCQLT
jgi:hypothetical protein